MKMQSSSSRSFAGIAGLLAGASLTAIALSAPAHGDNPKPLTDSPTAAAPFAAPPANLADLVERVSPSVVQIIVRQSSPMQRLSGPDAFDGLPPEFRPFFGQGFSFFGDGSNRSFRELPDRVGSGSGFFIDGGYIVTNNHVVDNAKKLKVRLDDGTEIDGELVGKDEKTDLAVVKVDAKYARKALQWGDSDKSRVGDNVFTIGAPYSLGNTVTAGILSARGRDISSGPYDDYFQIDAPINPGNSGGPMFNSAGQVIGVNTAIYSPSGGNVGIGFSIPSDQAQSVVRQIIDRGYVERGWLGVNIQKVTPEIAKSLGFESAHGVLVAEVTAGSPAEKAGLKPQDVILAYGGKPVTTMHDLTRAVAETRPGASTDLKVLREGRERTLTVKIAALDKGDAGKATRARPLAAAGKLSLEGLGLELAEDGQGVVIADVEPNSSAGETGLRSGDHVLSLNDVQLHSTKDAERALADARSKRREAVLVRIERNGDRLYLGVPISGS